MWRRGLVATCIVSAIACGSFGTTKDDAPATEPKDAGAVTDAALGPEPTPDGGTTPLPADDAGLLNPGVADAALCVVANSGNECTTTPECCVPRSGKSEVQCRSGRCRFCNHAGDFCNFSTFQFCCDPTATCNANECSK